MAEIGIEDIGVYIPHGRISNVERAAQFGVDHAFISQKIGISQVSRKAAGETTAEMAVAAVEALVARSSLDLNSVQALVVVTQNPDVNIPHTAAIVHGALKMPERCACFDISLGCSGYVYGLSILASFMAANKFSKAILITSDPYSKIVDPDDKNTAMIFGDAASATLLSDTPRFALSAFRFGTLGEEHGELIVRDGVLYMNGRAIFNFAAKYVPADILSLLLDNDLHVEDIDAYVFHQGSRFIVDTIAKRTQLPQEKVLFDIEDYGNTVSSSIPVILQKLMNNGDCKKIVISGFGVGLSWSSALINRIA